MEFIRLWLERLYTFVLMNPDDVILLLGLGVSGLGSIWIATLNRAFQSEPLNMLSRTIPKRRQYTSVSPTNLYRYVRTLDNSNIVRKSNPAFEPLFHLINDCSPVDGLPAISEVDGIVVIPEPNEYMETYLELMENNNDISDPVSVVDDISIDESIHITPRREVFYYQGDISLTETGFSWMASTWNQRTKSVDKANEILDKMDDVWDDIKKWRAVKDETCSITQAQLSVQDLHDEYNTVSETKNKKITRGALLLTFGFILQGISAVL